MLKEARGVRVGGLDGGGDRLAGQAASGPGCEAEGVALTDRESPFPGEDGLDHRVSAR
jgi:hypothetical protein